MRIKKIATSVGVLGKILNTISTSTEDTYSCNYINDLSTYSTTEQVIGKWIDGKKIYRKVISYNKPAGESSSIVAHNISNFETIISYKGMTKNQTGEWRALPSFYSPDIATYNQSLYSMDNTTISIYYSTWYAARSATINIIIEYTKTTD